MHGCSSASAFVVNAEVDSMGGVFEGGVGIDTKTSPRQAAIEKVQAELRQEFDVREERRRELEFLEKGGNPLDFLFGKVTSVSVQSTSLTDQQPELFLTSEAKGSFPLTPSPRGDSVESSGRPGAHSACEPNSADNLMLFDAENDFAEGDRNSVHPSRPSIVPTEHSSQQDGSHNAKELGDSATFGLPKKAYKRRSRPSRDVARQSSADAVLGRGGHGSSLSSHHGSREAKGLGSEEEKIKEPKPMSPNGVTANKTDVDTVKAVESAAKVIKNDQNDKIISSTSSEDVQTVQCDQQSAVDTDKPPGVALADTIFEKERQGAVPMDLECPPHIKVENHVGQVNGLDSIVRDDSQLANDGPTNGAAPGTKVLDSESSCTPTSFSLDGNNDDGPNGTFKGETSGTELKPTVEGQKEIKVYDMSTCVDIQCSSAQQSYRENGFAAKASNDVNVCNGVEVKVNMEDKNQSELLHQTVESMEIDDCNGLGSVVEKDAVASTVPSGDSLEPPTREICEVRPDGLTNSSMVLPKVAAPARELVVASDGHKSSISESNKVDEDTILEEARIIEAKRKRIAELSMTNLPKRNCPKSQWDFVLEEMTWLANDFAQERIWKLTAAAKICHQAASKTRMRFIEQNKFWEHKKVASIIANAVLDFWTSVEEKKEEQEQYARKEGSFALQEYAVRFLKHNCVGMPHTQAEAPKTPDRISDLGISSILWEDHLTEENLFYTVLPGAAETYRRSIELHIIKYEKTGSSIQEEGETSAYDVGADFGSQDMAYDEDEGETSTYDTSVLFDGSRSSRFSQIKWKNPMKAYNGRTYEVVADSPFMQCMENKSGNQQLVQLGKRPAGSLNVSFPTKRMRTNNNRQRVVSPFGAGTSGCVPVTTKTDASSGDTNSFQDDQSTMHGGLHLPNSMEVESPGEFEKQLQFDSPEISAKNKKKKKPKHMGSAYEHRWQVDTNCQNEHRWQVDTNCQNEQRDYSKKRSDGHQLESNGSSGLFGQHMPKKPKIMRQSVDNSYESGAPIGGSAPSPLAAQYSNQKIMKLLSGRERNRKSKGLKMPTGELGSGSPWTLFEEQALVVLVHDLGPNWELVSDAINSTLQFKCIYRNPKECKERHKLLMDRTGDGADSTEDSGSSQPYNSTLPGIPKGSARQLFQRLQGPMEEDTLRCHFDKIIVLGQKLHSRRKQDPKQLQPPHSSHMFALSQYCPNYLSTGQVLTPLDLCDATSPSAEMLPIGYQGQHTGGLPVSNQASMAPMHNGPMVNSSVPGSSNMVVGNNFSSSPSQVNPSARDARYAVPRSASLSTEEQQRMQQYNQLLPGRSLPQSNSPSPGGLPGNDRGVRMLPGGNAMGIPSGMNRNLPIARPGYQGIGSPSMLNSGNMISSGMVAVQSPVNMHPGGQGNSIRPRDTVHTMRPGQNQDPQGQIPGTELQSQVSQGSNPGIAPYATLGSSFPNQAGSPPVASYPVHNQQSHGLSQQQPHVHHPHIQGTNQAYAARLAKDRQLQQQRIMQQQQQQFASSNSMMPQAQPPSLPVSSPPQSSTQIQPQTSSPPVSLSPLTSGSPVVSLTQQQQKPQGHGRGAQPSNNGPINPTGKPRQRQSQQQFQQSGRHHPQPRQQMHPQQQTKAVKGVVRGNTMHQNSSIDPSVMNGLPTNPANQTVEKEQAMHLLHGQGLYSGPKMNPMQTGKQPVPKNLNQVPPMVKHLQQIPSHSDTASQGHISPATSSPVSTGHQPMQPLTASSNHQLAQVQPNKKLGSQNQTSVQRVSQQKRHLNSDQSKPQGGESQSGPNSTSNASQVGSVATPSKTSNETTNGVQVVSPASAPQWRTSEPLHDSSASSPATNYSPMGTSPTISSGSEPSSQVGQKGLGRRQSSGNLPPIGLELSAQCQQPSPLQQSSPPVSQQQPSHQHSQQQTQLGGNGSDKFARPTDSRLE